tara:strand:- start:342 stop:557 length:216 start_codon:yes stop_codon:yes gene_type:complete
MNLIEATESQLRATLDRCAFEINVCVQDQAENNRYDKFAATLKEYAETATALEVLEKVKLQLSEKEKKDED